MRFVNIARSMASALPIVCLIVTASLAPAQADVIELKSPITAEPVFVSSVTIVGNVATLNLSGAELLPPFPGDFNAIIALFHGSSALKQDLYEELRLNGANVLYSIVISHSGLTLGDTLGISFGAVEEDKISSKGSFVVFTGIQWGSGAGTGVFVGSPAVPESSTWSMLLLGFAGIGIARYRRARWQARAAHPRVRR